MKAATGELNLTLITVVAIGLVAALFTVLWDDIKAKITGNMGDTSDKLPSEDAGDAYKFDEYIESELF